MKRVALPLVGLLGLTLLSGCTAPDPGPGPGPEPTASSTEATCPEVAPVEVAPIEAGTEAQHAADLLAAYADWANAGTSAVADDPAWRAADLPKRCLPELAKANSAAFVGTLFVTRQDAAWEKYYARREAMNLANLTSAQLTGSATTTAYDLQQMIEYSHTDSGSFVKFSATYHPGDVRDDKLEQWYVAMALWEGNMIIDHIEAKAETAG